MTDYAVIRTQLEPIHINLVREVLINVGGMPKIDAAQTSRRQQGILGERFTQEQAEAIVAALEGMGLKFRAMPADHLQKLDAPKSIQSLQLTEQGLAIPLGYRGDVRIIPWSSIFVLSAGNVAEVEEERRSIQRTKNVDIPGVANFQVNMPDEEVVRNSRKKLVAELIGMDTNHQLQYVRFGLADFNFARVQPAVTPGPRNHRFVQLLLWLVQHARYAVVSGETMAILEQRGFDNAMESGEYKALSESHAFRERTRWLLQMAVLQELQRQSPS